MIPIKNEFVNRTLNPPQGYSENEIGKLHVWTDDSQCVSEWRLSFKERISALLFGRIWLSVLSGSTQPPVCLTARRKFLVHKEEE